MSATASNAAKPDCARKDIVADRRREHCSARGKQCHEDTDPEKCEWSARSAGAQRRACGAPCRAGCWAVFRREFQSACMLLVWPAVSSSSLLSKSH